LTVATTTATEKRIPPLIMKGIKRLRRKEREKKPPIKLKIYGRMKTTQFF